MLNFIFPPPVSLLVTIMSVVTVVAYAGFGFSEIRGRHLNFSKFWNMNSSVKMDEFRVSGKTGMVVFYAPAFFTGLSSFWIFPNHNFRFVLLSSALTLHFFKRIFEVLFIHKYSGGGMMVDSMIVVSSTYFIFTATMIYSQHLSQGLIIPEPSIDLKYIGLVLFLFGISGNLYHHYLLSRLRKEGENGYKIPKGGLFDQVVCPHYLFEILEFIGVSFISQNLYTFFYTLGATFYITGRSYATRRWYISKFEEFPKNVKALVPYVF